MISVLFKDYFFKYKLKRFVKKILFVRNSLSGPIEVEKILLEYIQESKLNIYTNHITSETRFIFCEGLDEKELSAILKIKNKIAPNSKIIIHHGFSHPNELKNKGILDYIDLILVPSEWVKKLFISEMNGIKTKVKSFPFPCSDITQSGDNIQRGDLILVYDKCEGFRPKPDYSDFMTEIKEFANNNAMEVKIISYGNYEQMEYIRQLRECRFMIYLSQQETQGLALMQAWAQNTPTLIYDKEIGHWDNVVCPASSAPYYDPKVGLKFKNSAQLESSLFLMMEKCFTPKSYYDANFSKEKIFNDLDLIVQ
jgi:hypothetical protein